MTGEQKPATQPLKQNATIKMVSFLSSRFTTHYLLTYWTGRTQFASTRWDSEPTLADRKVIWNIPKHHINTMLELKRKDFIVVTEGCHEMLLSWKNPWKGGTVGGWHIYLFIYFAAYVKIIVHHLYRCSSGNTLSSFIVYNVQISSQN